MSMSINSAKTSGVVPFIGDLFLAEESLLGLVCPARPGPASDPGRRCLSPRSVAPQQKNHKTTEPSRCASTVAHQSASPQYPMLFSQGKSRIFGFASGGYRGPLEFYIRFMKSSISGDSRRRVSSKRNIFEFLRSSASGPG
uniref:Uncharacterized protein n=1 Tax=Anopheles melas TaxID=34690 RepID=A0A182TYE1_9DIPT